jgi:hypothetical protein
MATVAARPPGRSMVVSLGMPAEFKAAAIPCRTKKPPSLAQPCTKITGEMALMLRRAQARVRQLPTLARSGRMVNGFRADGEPVAGSGSGNVRPEIGSVRLCWTQAPLAGAMVPTVVPLSDTVCDADGPT